MTRQSANLMEDFSRELKAGAALFLLYGESDVGKTRLWCRSLQRFLW
jgi:ATP-dependent Clp protease ATP-binding subunit ClpA